MNVITCALTDRKLQPFEDFFGKARSYRGDLIRTWRQGRQAIRAIRPGFDHLGDAGACIGGRDCGPGDYGAGLIHHGSTQSCGGIIHLAEERWRHQKSEYKCGKNEVSGLHWGNLLQARMCCHAQNEWSVIHRSENRLKSSQGSETLFCTGVKYLLGQGYWAG